MTLDARGEVPITAMKSPSHAQDFVVVEQGTPNYRQASLEVRDGDLNQDVVLAYHLEKPRTGIDSIASKQGRDDGYFQLTLSAGKELEQAQQGDYVFVLDVSGSMAFDGKLGTSRQSVDQFVAGLGEKDRFEVITFNVAANPLFSKLTDVSDQSRQAATQFIGSQKARGGTVLRPAVELAYRYRQDDRPLNVVILSDGMTELNEQRELLAAAANKPAGTTLFCIGIGNEVNRPLLTQLASDAGGLAAFISAGDDFRRQAEAFRRKLTRPAMTGVQIKFPEGNVYDIEPKQLPNLYHGQPLRLYGRYRKGETIAVELKADVQGLPLQDVVKLELPDRDEKNPEIDRMWAFQRVNRLMADGRRGGNLESLKPEIVRLCEGFSIASEYASFIVLENDAEYQRWKIDRRNVTRVAAIGKHKMPFASNWRGYVKEPQQQLGPQSADRPQSKSVATNRPGRPIRRTCPGRSIRRRPIRSRAAVPMVAAAVAPSTR